MIPLSGNSVLELNDNRRFDQDGFLIVPNVISQDECETLGAELTELFEQQQQVSRKAKGGLRNVLKCCPRARALAYSAELLSLVDGLAEKSFFPVRGMLFDKQPHANWGVPWHQDLAVAVSEKIDAPGFGPWSVKEGIVHVQPPTHILAEMVAIRLHLDACAADNGALRVIPGSHRDGELDSDTIDAWVGRSESVVCEVLRGGALMMRPLLLHASSPARIPSHRRVLHIEYSSVGLPNGLKWLEQ